MIISGHLTTNRSIQYHFTNLLPTIDILNYYNKYIINVISPIFITHKNTDIVNITVFPQSKPDVNYLSTKRIMQPLP